MPLSAEALQVHTPPCIFEFSFSLLLAWLFEFSFSLLLVWLLFWSTFLLSKLFMERCFIHGSCGLAFYSVAQHLRFGSRLKRSILFSSFWLKAQKISSLFISRFSSLCFGLGLSCYPTDCIHSRIPRSSRNMSNVAYAVQALFWSRAYCLRGSKTGRPSTKDRAG